MMYDLEYRVTDMGIDSWHKKEENFHAGKRCICVEHMHDNVISCQFYRVVKYWFLFIYSKNVLIILIQPGRFKFSSNDDIVCLISDCIVMDARSASVHVIFCRCFLCFFFNDSLSWPNG